MSEFVLARWYGGRRWGVLYPFAKAAELAYSVAATRRMHGFLCGRRARVKLPVSVVSVGNITVGGTGKTALAAYLARDFAKRGFSPAVLTRGYFSSVRGVVKLVGSAKTCDPRACGDEPVLLARSLDGVPVWVGRDRATSGRMAVDDGADVLILDDGFQHLKLWRDVDIVCINSRAGVGNGALLPIGPMREPADSIERADAVVIVGGDGGVPRFAARACERGLFGPVRAEYVVEGLRNIASGEFVRLDECGFGAVGAFCGIAIPDGFFKTLEVAGLKLVWRRTFRDHHFYSASELSRIVEAARAADAEAVITTQKDGVRIKPEWLVGAALDLWELVVKLVVEDEEAFWEWLLGRLRRRGA